MQNELRKVLKEELGKIHVIGATQTKPKKAVPSATLEIFSALQQDAPE